MPYNAEPGEVAYVVASKLINHGDVVAEQGFTGEAVKQTTPAADLPRTQRAQIAVNESYLLLIGKVIEVPATGALASPTKGTLVYITTADNTLSTASGAGKVPLGRVCSLPGERGTPANKVRINQRQKV